MRNKLEYNTAARCFEEALPIGNGSLGAMVYGGADVDRLSLNYDTLWSGKPKRTVRPNAYNAYTKARDSVLNDDTDTAEDLICDEMNADWSQSYLPMGNLYIKSDVRDFVDYSRTLDMQNAIVNIEFKSEDAMSKREYFSSNPDDAIVIKYTDEIPQKYELSVDSQLLSSVEYKDDCIILKGECPSNLFPGDRPAEIPCTYDGTGIKFTTIIKVLTDGKTSRSDKALCVEDSTEMRIYIAAKTSYIDYNTLPTAETDVACERKIQNVTDKEYKQIKDEHIKDFSGFYNRTDIDLKSNIDMPTDELIKSGKSYAALAELIFNYAKYLMISASRPNSQAMNLQGIWNEKFQPPWCCSYTMNINTEMNYWAALPLDLAEMQQPFLSLAKKLSDTGRTTAKEYYHSDGYVSHHVTDLWGMSTVCGPKAKRNCSWGFWNMSSAWLLNELFKTYEYTKNIEYLKTELYPMIKGFVTFCKGQIADENGKKILLMSTSPENGYMKDGKRYAVAKYTAMTQEMLIILFNNFVKSCEILNTDNALKQEIKEIIPNLYTFEVGSDGQLLEWDREYEEEDIHHRHVSHLYGVYPGGLFTEKSDKQMYDASRKSLEIRGDDGTGWSIAWKINLWAKFKDGNHSFDVFKNQMQYAESEREFVDENGLKTVKTVGVHGGTYANLFDAHPPFQIDGNFGAAMGIIQWFVQCEDGVIKILPALPDELSCGRVDGLMAEGNIKLFIEWNNGKCTKLSALTPISQTAVFEINGENMTAKLKENEKTKVWFK